MLHGGEIKEREAILSLHHLYQFVNFIDYCYSNEFVERYFDEQLLPLSANIKFRETPQSMAKLQNGLPNLPDFDEQIVGQSLAVQETYTEKRKQQLYGKMYLSILINCLKQRQENSLLISISV